MILAVVMVQYSHVIVLASIVRVLDVVWVLCCFCMASLWYFVVVAKVSWRYHLGVLKAIMILGLEAPLVAVWVLMDSSAVAQWCPCLTGCCRVMQETEQVVLVGGQLCFVFLVQVGKELPGEMDPHCLDMVA